MRWFILLLLTTTVWAQEPFEAYQAYRAALEQATTFADLTPYVSLEALGEDLEPRRVRRFLDFARQRSPHTVELVEESLDNEAVYLTLAGQKEGKPLIGEVVMIFEGGAWKLRLEKWGPASEGQKTSRREHREDSLNLGRGSQQD